MKFKRLETRWTAARPGALNNPWRRRKFAPFHRRTERSRRWRSRSEEELVPRGEETRRQNARPASAPRRRGAPRKRARPPVRTFAPRERAEFAAFEDRRPRSEFVLARRIADALSAPIFAPTPRAACASPQPAPVSRAMAAAPRFRSRSDAGSRVPDFASRPVSHGGRAPHAEVFASRFVSRKAPAPYAKETRCVFGVPAPSARRPARALRDGTAPVRNSSFARGLMAPAPASFGSDAPRPVGFAAPESAPESAPRRRFAPFTRRLAVPQASSGRAFASELRAAFDVARASESGMPFAVEPPTAAHTRRTLGLERARRPVPRASEAASRTLWREGDARPKRARTAFPGAFAAPYAAPASAPRVAPARRTELPAAVPQSAARGVWTVGSEPFPDALGALSGGLSARTSADESARSLAALERLVKEARDALHALVRGQSRAVTLDTDWS